MALKEAGAQIRPGGFDNAAAFCGELVEITGVFGRQNDERMGGARLAERTGQRQRAAAVIGIGHQRDIGQHDRANRSATRNDFQPRPLRIGFHLAGEILGPRRDARDPRPVDPVGEFLRNIDDLR